MPDYKNTQDAVGKYLTSYASKTREQALTLSESEPNAVFFPTDSNLIVFAGKEFGVGGSDSGLTKSDIANNLTTKEDGKVLDARQAGVLKKIIDESKIQIINGILRLLNTTYSSNSIKNMFGSHTLYSLSMNTETQLGWITDEEGTIHGNQPILFTVERSGNSYPITYSVITEYKGNRYTYKIQETSSGVYKCVSVLSEALQSITRIGSSDCYVQTDEDTIFISADAILLEGRLNMPKDSLIYGVNGEASAVSVLKAKLFTTTAIGNLYRRVWCKRIPCADCMTNNMCMQGFYYEGWAELDFSNSSIGSISNIPVLLYGVLYTSSTGLTTRLSAGIYRGSIMGNGIFSIESKIN